MTETISSWRIGTDPQGTWLRMRLPAALVSEIGAVVLSALAYAMTASLLKGMT
jgi:hypothetical protein